MADGQIISPALVALLGIMTSADIPEAQCVEAAKAIIEYEAPPEIFDLTHEYLMGVAQDPEQPVGLKLEALKLIRKVEAKRVMPGTAQAVDSVAAMELGRRVVTAKRRVELMRRGEWPAPDGWGENLGEVRGIVVGEEGLAVALDAARERVAGR